MADISNKTLALLVGIAIIISVSGIFVAQRGVVSITGRAADTGTGKVNLSIISVASINVTQNIEFGSGIFDVGSDSATLDSETTAASGGNWSYDEQYITVENDGNVNLSVTIASDKNATDLLSTSGTGQLFQFHIQEDDADSCGVIQNGSSYATGNFTNYIAATKLNICDSLDSQSASNSLNMSAKIVVPKEATKDTNLEAEITFEGTSS